MRMWRSLCWKLVAGVVLTLCGVVPAVAQSGSVTIDDQPTTEQNLARINDLRRAARHDDAADLLQELVDGARFKLVRVDGGLYIDAELWARRELSRDPALLSAYRDRYTASGERALLVAQDDGELVSLREAYRRFGMTRPGLESGLLLTGRLLERGEIAAASALMAELRWHPDQHEESGRVAYLQGVCAALRGDAEQAAEIEGRLRDRSAAWANRLVGLSSAMAIPSGGGGIGLVDAGPRPEGLEVPLWEAPIRMPMGPPTERSAFDGLRSLPLAQGDRVFVNTSSQVHALDRASGQPLWAYPPEAGPRPGFEMNLPVWRDTRGVAASGGRLFTILGACRGVQGRGGAEVVPPNLLVCLNPQTGRVIWSRRSGEILEGEPTVAGGSRGGRGALLQTHFVGTPVSAQGQVFSLVRKTSRAGLQTTWLASFGATDGRLRWFRHIALVQVRQDANAVQITPQLSLEGDTLYVTDHIAVVASVDVHSGAYRWLRVLADDRERRSNSLSIETDGVMTPPVLTPAGLVVQLPSSDQRLFLLDPDNGRTLRAMYEDQRLRGAQYILDAGDDVVVVSRSYAVLWDGQSGEVRWVHGFEQGSQPRGRGAVTQQFVVLPTNHGLTTLRLTDGEVLSEFDGLSGNLLALDEEVLVSTNGYVQSYMSWDGAYARLVARAARRPEDPSPGMSLAVLALDRGENDQTVLDGLALAIAAVDRAFGEDAALLRQQVFDGLRTMAGPDSVASDALRNRVFDLMAQTAATPAQAVAYHMDRGQQLAETQAPERAVGHFQSVMVDPGLSSAAYGRQGGGASGPAGAAAQRALLALVQEHGRGVYHRYDALAKQELESLMAQGDPDPVALGQIAKRYPLALCASQALSIAAERLETAGQLIGALSQFQQALDRAITPDQRHAAAGALLSFYERSERHAEALEMLDRLEQTDGVINPPRLGQPTSTEDWRNVFRELDRAAVDGSRLAEAFGRPVILPGRLLLPPPRQPTSTLRGGLFVHTEAGEVARLDAARSAAVRWSVPVPGRQLHVLADDQGQVLVWSVDTQTLFALDSETGEPLWETPADLTGVSGGPEDAARPGARVLPEELPWVRVGPLVVAVVGPSGQAMGIDRYTGATQWEADTGITRVTTVSGDPRTLAVGGVVGPELDLNHGKLVLLDLHTGTPTLDRLDLHVDSLPLTLGLADGKLAVVAETGTEVAVFDSATGDPLWQQPLGANDATASGMAHGPILALQDTDGLVYVLRYGGAIQDNNVIARFRLAMDGNPPLVSMQQMGAGMLLLGTQGAVALSAEGRVLWRDARHTRGGHLHQALLGTGRVALIASDNSGANPDVLLQPGQSVRYRIELLGRGDGLLQQSYTLGPIQGQLDPRRAVITGGGIAIDMGPRTLLVPAADPASADPPDAPRRQ